MSLILKTYFELIEKIRYLLEANKSILIEDMEKSESFNPEAEYGEKNIYFNRANQVGLRLIIEGFPNIAEIYYNNLLNIILEFESSNPKSFNKGIVYANLGIAQMAINKFNEGLPNLIKANQEDKAFKDVSHKFGLFDSRLYKQFENKTFEMIHQDLNFFAGQKGITITEDDILNFLSSLDVESRLFITTIIRELKQNLTILNNNENRFTRILLFSNLKDLCLFIENYFKNIIENNLTLPNNKDLYNFINVIFNSKPWWSELQQQWNLTRSANINDFEKNLQNISNKENMDIRRLLYLGCVRNFSAHYFNVESYFLFSNFEAIYKNILGAIFWIYSKYM